MNKIYLVTNPVPSDNFFNRLWYDEQKTQRSFIPIEMRWYEADWSNIAKQEAKKLYKKEYVGMGYGKDA